MSDKRLDAILESYGAAPERWPADEQAAALALLGRSDDARRRWVETAALDLLLQPDPAPDPSGDLIARLKAIPANAPAPTPRPKSLSSIFAMPRLGRFRAAGAFAAVALAFLAGLAMPAPFAGTEPNVLATAGTLDAGFADPATESGFAVVDPWGADAETLAEPIGEDGEIDFPELAVLDLTLD